jgi:DNA polymerase-4
MTEKSVPWMFIDMNSFFASVEQQENPALIGKPVAVLPGMSEHTCAIAASYEAKAFGIKTGTIIRDALEMCPHLNCVPARHDVYRDYHDMILTEADRHTRVTKVCSIDEFSSRLWPSDQPIEKATALAERIRQGFFDNIGPAIQCSIGLAPNAYLAKVASDMQKPNGLTILTKDNLKEKLFPMRLTDFPGIGANMQKRLNRGGIWTVEQIWNCSPKHFRKIWGSVEGEKFWYRLHGEDVPDRPESEKVMIGHSRVLDPQHRDPHMAKQIGRRLLVKAASRLRRAELLAGAVSLGIRTTDDLKWGIEERCPAIDDNLGFIRTYSKLWDVMMREVRPYRLKKVSITFHHLSPAGWVTDNLLEFSDAQSRQWREKSRALSQSMDGLTKKYGGDKITFGASPKTMAGFVGTKIAFSRIPDKEEFYE